jgi:hypothetical protein
LKQHGLAESESLLEIGSGPVGVGKFRKIRFVGCDLSFLVTPLSPMAPLIASAAALPFWDGAFDVVLASDVMEHVPGSLRSAVVSECLRVAKKLVVFAFPSGEIAHRADRELLNVYLTRKLPPPPWLQEHMIEPFPGEELFENISGWEVTQTGNESVRFHSWMMRVEMSRIFNYGARGCLKFAPRLVELLLSGVDGAPFYRTIFTLRKSG